jgi:hypothetical protein
MEYESIYLMRKSIKRIEPYPSGLRLHFRYSEIDYIVDFDIQLLGQMVGEWERSNKISIDTFKKYGSEEVEDYSYG